MYYSWQRSIQRNWQHLQKWYSVYEYRMADVCKLLSFSSIILTISLYCIGTSWEVDMSELQRSKNCDQELQASRSRSTKAQLCKWPTLSRRCSRRCWILENAVSSTVKARSIIHPSQLGWKMVYALLQKSKRAAWFSYTCSLQQLFQFTHKVNLPY